MAFLILRCQLQWWCTTTLLEVYTLLWAWVNERNFVVKLHETVCNSPNHYSDLRMCVEPTKLPPLQFIPVPARPSSFTHVSVFPESSIVHERRGRCEGDDCASVYRYISSVYSLVLELDQDLFTELSFARLLHTTSRFRRHTDFKRVSISTCLGSSLASIFSGVFLVLHGTFFGNCETGYERSITEKKLFYKYHDKGILHGKDISVSLFEISADHVLKISSTVFFRGRPISEYRKKWCSLESWKN